MQQGGALLTQDIQVMLLSRMERWVHSLGDCLQGPAAEADLGAACRCTVEGSDTWKPLAL